MTVQCAWCNLLKDPTGQYTIACGSKILIDQAGGQVSHGICEGCSGELLAS